MFNCVGNGLAVSEMIDLAEKRRILQIERLAEKLTCRVESRCLPHLLTQDEILKSTVNNIVMYVKSIKIAD